MGGSGNETGERAPHVGQTVLGCIVLTAFLAASRVAAADEHDPPPQPAPVLPYSGNLDGDHLYLGPIGAAVQIDGSWDTSFGAQLAWLRIRERRVLAAAGLTVGGARYSARDGGRIWLEAVVGTRRLGGLMTGLSAGPVIELGTLEQPRLGGAASIWVFAGIIPYLRAGHLDEAGTFVEVGLALELPVWRW